MQRRPRLSLILTALMMTAGIFTVGCASMGRDQERGQLLLRLGTSQIESGDYPNALRTMIEAEKTDDSSPAIQNNLGLAYFFRDRLDLAEEHMRRALELSPTYTEAKNNLARVLVDRNRPKEAVVLLKDALLDLTYPKPARLNLNLGIALFHAKQYTESRQQFSKTLEFNRDNCLAQSYLGRSFFETQDFKKASEILDRAVGFCKASQFDEPHYYSALAYYQLGEKGKAESRLEEVTRLYSQGKYTEQAKSLLETIRR